MESRPLPELHAEMPAKGRNSAEDLRENLTFCRGGGAGGFPSNLTLILSRTSRRATPSPAGLPHEKRIDSRNPGSGPFLSIHHGTRRSRQFYAEAGPADTVSRGPCFAHAGQPSHVFRGPCESTGGRSLPSTRSGQGSVALRSAPVHQAFGVTGRAGIGRSLEIRAT
jgi:hypothetical protein